jgi:hypothetical protein
MKTRTQPQKQQQKIHKQLESDNTLLNDQRVINEIKEEIKSLLQVNENENTTYWNLWETPKAVLRGKFIAMSGYIKRIERPEIND